MPQITADCIGPLAVHSTLEKLRFKFAASDTVWYGEPGSHPFAALKFAPRGLVAVATQFMRSVNVRAAAEAWKVPSGTALLPGELPMNATWAELKKTYGGPFVAGRVWYMGAEFCSLPGIMFELGVDPMKIKYDRSGNPLNLPDSVRVEAVDFVQSGLGNLCSTK